MIGVAVLQQPAERVVAEPLHLTPIRIHRHARLVGGDAELGQDAAVLITAVQSATARSSCVLVLVVLRSIEERSRAGEVAL